jgi:hypothetical protein
MVNIGLADILATLIGSAAGGAGMRNLYRDEGG